MLRILQIVPNMNMGGLESFIMNVYEKIDRSKIQFDFLEHYKEESFYDKDIIKLGGKVYHFSLRDDNNIFKYIWQLFKFFHNHKEYKIIHCHMESIGAIPLFIAKLYGVKVRIGHAHTSKTTNSFKGRLKFLLSKVFKYTTTDNFACSNVTGKYLYKNKDFIVVKNGIDFTKFKYDLVKRKKIREELKISDDIKLIGHIGRMDRPKNQTYLIDIFNECLKKSDNIHLLLVGDGKMMNELETKVKNLNIEKYVTFMGVRKDIDYIYSAIDLFIFPSLFEGLPLTLIEAQINGVPIITSSSISRETKISDNIIYLNLAEDIRTWIDEIQNKIGKRDTHYNENKKEFDINNVTNYMESYYLESINRRESKA